jgi:hypothetical protein
MPKTLPASKTAAKALTPFPVHHRFSGEVLFTANIDCPPDAPPSLKLGLAVKWGVANKANLRWADLSWADLRSADLSSADLRWANLRWADLSWADLSSADLRSADLRSADLRWADLRWADLRWADLRSADLRSADLSSADLRQFKADLWMTLTQNRAEVPGLITALKAGKVNGSTYTGPCACLVGTIANVRGVDYVSLDHDSGNPAERWFTMIKEGDKPGDDSGGGFASKMALEWAEEFCRLSGISIGEAAQ